MPNQTTKLNMEIANLEDEKEQVNSEIAKANTQYNIGAFGVFFGILLVVLSAYWIGGLMFLAGILAALTQGSKKRSLAKKVESIQLQIKEKRNVIIESVEI